jgi:SynChlorMet cassette protein ScmC
MHSSSFLIIQVDGSIIYLNSSYLLMTIMPDAQCYSLTLADGMRWIIRAGDPDVARIVSALGAAMQLQLALPALAEEQDAREMLVVVQRGKTPLANLSGPGPAVCTLPPLLNDDMLNIDVSHLALAIAREAQSRGGMLVHGALASFSPSSLPLEEKEGNKSSGILLAGPGTVGKTTASSRLPPPWRSLCDDAALVVCDPQGRYWAHPWPTWSRFYGDGPGGSWDVQRTVPLRAIFFLSQSSDDRAEALHVTQATAMLMETVQHVSRSMTRHLSDGETQALYREQLAAVEALVRAIPAYTLHISLNGTFWEELDRVLHDHATRITFHAISHQPPATRYQPPATRIEAPTTIESILDDGALHVVYTGPSMNPTLREPDLLEVETCDNRQVRPGDVIYFWPPGGEREVVHRVVQVTSGGIRTRGDNNSQEDPYLLQPTDIIGQVVAAQRGVQRRRIAGGRWGVLVGTVCRPWRLANRGLSRLLHSAYRALAGAGRWRRLLPAGLWPHVYLFRTRNQSMLKLLIGGHIIGQYDIREEQWRIRRPFRLFVNEAALPVLAPQRVSRLREKDPKGLPTPIGSGSGQG